MNDAFAGAFWLCFVNAIVLAEALGGLGVFNKKSAWGSVQIQRSESRFNALYTCFYITFRTPSGPGEMLAAERMDMDMDRS